MYLMILYFITAQKINFFIKDFDFESLGNPLNKEQMLFHQIIKCIFFFCALFCIVIVTVPELNEQMFYIRMLKIITSVKIRQRKCRKKFY